MKGRLRRLSISLGVASLAFFGLVPSAAQAGTGADLQVTATWVGRGTPRAAVGQTVTLDVALTNLGPEAASAVYLFPLTPDQFNPLSLTCNDATFCSSPGGTLAPGATVTATVEDFVCCFTKSDGRMTSAGATVFSDTADPDAANSSSELQIRLVGPHGFAVPA